MPTPKKPAKKTAAKKPAAKPAAKKPAAKKPAAKKRKPNPALMKPVQPDDVLAKVVGSKPIPRGEIVKKLWDYIKKNGLQDQKKKTNINADDVLKAVFNGKKQVTMFEMTKLVSGHVKA
jgi:chromatin remodeling complex protein RSC6